MHAGYAGVGFEGAECLAGEDCAGGAGDGEGEVGGFQDSNSFRRASSDSWSPTLRQLREGWGTEHFQPGEICLRQSGKTDPCLILAPSC